MMIAKRNCSEGQATNIIAVIPYLAYTKNKIEFLPGEVVTMSLIARYWKVSALSNSLQIDASSHIVTFALLESICRIYMHTFIANYTEEKVEIGYADLLLTNIGGAPRAKTLASVLKTNCPKQESR